VLTYYSGMTFHSDDLLARFADLILAQRGDATDFSHTSDPADATAESLVFVGAPPDLPSRAAIVVGTQEVIDVADANTAKLFLSVADVRLAMAHIKQVYNDYDAADSEWPAIHPSAVVHESAQLGYNCRIGPNAVIGARAVLADGVIIRAGAVVEHDARIGEDSVVHANANIGYGCILGKRVIVKANAVIGGEGFGYAKDQENAYHRIPHTGIAVLEDDVRIGSCSCVDRATFGETRVERGVKVDNIVHIAHNCQIGEDSILISQTGIAGSTVLGKRVICSGQTGTLDHKTIADDVVLVHRAAVTDDIPEAGMYGGNPLLPFRDHMQRRRWVKKFKNIEQKLTDLRSKIVKEPQQKS